MSHAFSDSKPGPLRAFGDFELHRLLNRSAATMLWLARDCRQEREMLLTLPRTAPADAAELERWLQRVRHAARLDHPNLARVAATGVVDGWPFVAVERGAGSTLAEWLALYPQPAPAVVAGWLCATLQGLAFAHEAGIAHLDMQLHSLLVDERGRVAVMALGASDVCDAPRVSVPVRREVQGLSTPHDELKQHRTAAERDVLACGVLLQHLLAGRSTDDDIAAIIARMPPQGREALRLPWTTPLPVDAALRAIADRSTAGTLRLRYRNARTLLGALQGWREAERGADTGPVALLLERLQSVGHLPALPGLASRIARVTGIESRRTDEIARGILPDLALAFELLRALNSVEMQGTQIASGGPVLTLRRVVALIGIDGVRRAANTLRPWPGPLEAPAATALQAMMQRTRLAGHVAQTLRPAGYDAEVVFLIAVLQNLGRLMLGYHFAEEAAQIEQLMLPEAGGDVVTLDECAAAQAVLGVDIDALGFAVARHWGLPEEVQQMMHRLPLDLPVRRPDRDIDVLRLAASAANETVDAVARLPARRLAPALAQVVQRYGRLLALNVRSLEDALASARAQAAREPLADDPVATEPAPAPSDAL